MAITLNGTTGITTPDIAETDGKVGIGVSSPQEKLHVIGSAKLDFGSGGGNPRLYFDHDTVTDDANYIQLNRGDAGLEIISEDNLKFDTNGSERMRINSSGNLLVGTTSGSDKVTVNGTVNATAFVGDGSALTGVGGSTTAGAVGTYIMARQISNGVTYILGSTASGSVLYPANTYQSGGSSGYDSRYGSLSGTWRCMGETNIYNGTTTGTTANVQTTSWLRIS